MFLFYNQGAALFAKRRKRSENWVIDEHNVKSISPSLSEPANINHGGSNITIHPQGTGRAENIQKMNEIQVRISQCNVLNNIHQTDNSEFQLHVKMLFAIHIMNFSKGSLNLV